MKREIIYFRETNWQSIVADTYMFLSIIAAMAVNHFYLGDSSAWAVILFIMILILAASRANTKKKQFGSEEEIIEHLNKSEPVK